MNISMFQRLPDIRGEDEEDTELLRQMAEDARSYITSFAWCPPISAMYFADGVGGIVALFLVKLARKIQEHDDQLWIVVGDLPRAYMVVESDETPSIALRKYCSLMREWSESVLHNRSLDDVFPVDANPSAENALNLKERLAFIEREVINKKS